MHKTPTQAGPVCASSAGLFLQELTSDGRSVQSASVRPLRFASI